MGSRSLGLKIRRAVHADCEELASIYQESLDGLDCCMEVQTSTESFLNLLNGFQDREALLVAQGDDRLYGWATLKRYSDRVGYRVACETSIYMRRRETGRGYGSRLQQALMELAKDFGYHHIVAKIWASNTGSLRFHEKFGYQVLGVQKEVGYLGGEWRDVAILQCLLSEVGPYRPDLA